MKTLIGWVVGAFTVLLALGALLQSAWLAVLSFVSASAFALPPTLKYIREASEKKGRSVSTSLAIAGYLAFFISGLVFFPLQKTENDSITDESSPAKVVTETPQVTENPESQPEEIIKEEASEQIYFPFTADEFIERYNLSLANLDRSMTFHLESETENYDGKGITIQAVGDKNIGLVLSADNKTRKLYSFTFIGTGDGTLDSGLNVFMGILACVMAVDDPDMPPESHKEILEELGLIDSKFSEQEKTEFTRNGVEYTLLLTEQIGIWFIGEAIGEISISTQ